MEQTIAKYPHFQVLNERDIDWLVSQGRQGECQAGEILIQAGRQVEFIHISLSGTLAVTAYRQGEGERELKKLYAGEMMGEMSFLDNQLPPTTIKVLKQSRVLSISKQELGHKLERDEDFATRFYHLLALKLSNQLRGLSELLSQNQGRASQPLRKVLLVFAILQDRDIAWAIANGVSQKLSAGTVLIQQGKPVTAVYILLEGTLGIYISLPHGGVMAAKEVGQSMKGEILGEMSFVETGTASATVKAIADSWCLAIPQAKLASKLAGDLRGAARFYRSIAILMSNRWRERLFRRGFATLYEEGKQMLSEDIEVEDELDLDTIEGTAIAGTRFDWMIRQLSR